MPKSQGSVLGRSLLMMALGILVVPIGSVYGAKSFPGPAPTLIDLFSRAELVVHAEVLKTRLMAGQMSRLKVISVIKADKKKRASEFDVFIQFGSHWPIPFEEKRKTITFLEFDEERKVYRPISSRTGIDVENEELAKFLVKQFAKVPKILAEKDQRKQLFEKVQWYVEMVMFPPTRSDGAYGIASLWSRGKRAKLLTESERQHASNLLNESQKKAICRKLATETPEASATRIVEILKDYRSGELDRYLVKSIKRSMMFESALPIVDNRIALMGLEYLPKRIGFEIPEKLNLQLKEFKFRLNFFISNYYNKAKGDYSEEERARVYAEVVRLWRELATGFLNLPELAKTSSARSRKQVGLSPGL